MVAGVHSAGLKEHQCAQRLLVFQNVTPCFPACRLIFLVVGWLVVALAFSIDHLVAVLWIAVPLPMATVPSVYSCV